MGHLTVYHSIAISVGWALVMIALERRFPADRKQRLFREGFWLDLGWYSVFEGAVLGVVIGALITYIDTRSGFSRLRVVSDWPVPAQLAFFWVTHDLYIYWFHRWQHHNRYLWRIHEAHHSGKDVDWLSGARSHSLEILVNQTIEYAPITLLGAHPDVAILKGMLDACWGMFIHCNVDVKMGFLQYVFNGPELHRLHHSAIGEKTSNFATKIAVWDWLFGTAYRPGHSAEVYGLFGDPPYPKGYFKQHLWAFRPFEEGLESAAKRSRLRSPTVARAGSKRTGVAFLRAGAIAVALFILLRTLSRADLAGAMRLVAASGPALFLGLLPFAVMMGVDALVQKTLLERAGEKPKYLLLYGVRLVTEAFSTSLPAGVVFAEGTGPSLMRRTCGVAVDAAIAANAVKRWLTIRANAMYLALSALFGFATLHRLAPALGIGRGLAVIVVATAIALFLVSVALGGILGGRAWPQRLATRLRCLPFARLRSWLDASDERMIALDTRFCRLTHDKGTLAVATAMLLGSWLIESVETWLLLRLLGTSVGWTEVIAFEAGLSLVRSAAFFVPAGLGVQDVGYVAVIVALGVPGGATLGAAFVALKRAKEAIWITIGWLLAGALSVFHGRGAARAIPLSEEVMS